MKYELNIFDAIKSTGIELLKDYGDLGLAEVANIFDKELIKDVPYIGTIINLASFGTKVKGFFMAKKLISFLKQLEAVPLNKRQEFIKKLEDTQESKKVGEKLIVLIDALDDNEKAIMLGILFKKTIEGKIKLDTYNRLAIGIKNIYYGDLKLFIENSKENIYKLSDDINSSLYQNGFVSIKISDVKRQNSKNMTTHGIQNIVQPKLEFQTSELGHILLDNLDNV